VRRAIGQAINRVLRPLNVQVASSRRIYAQRRELEFLHSRIAWYERLAVEATVEAIPQSQLGQDLFALNESGFKRDGFFVEIGAASGVALSNTYLLERSFGWTGILAEPGRSWHASLRRRRRCIIDHRCVWNTSGDFVDFAEAPEGEYSTLALYADQVLHADRRAGSNVYEVETVTLQDLLIEHAAPSYIDFLSIDTEGTEFEILRGLDFDAWRFAALTLEHNYDAERRAKIRDLLADAGYQCVYDGLTAFDDWFVPLST
jgi:FkbM family methyltransferase